MSPTTSPPVQLPLRLVTPPGMARPTVPAVPLPPRLVWTGLSPPERTRLRTTLVALLQEVSGVHDAG
jgi:hypothetical protein